jgi:high-affinity iron transporter
MLTTALIAFREFLEAMLIISVFLGISRKLALKRELEICFAAAIGFAISLAFATTTYLFGDMARGILTQEKAETLESYIMIFSGLFITYVVFSLHGTLRKSRAGTLIKAHQQLQKNAFDISLFLTIIAVVLREGFEIALFTASTSLFSVFFQNFVGLLIGFACASVLGIGTFFAYLKFPLGKVFKVTEYMIVLLGASLVQNGITEFLEHTFDIHLSNMLQLPLQFLPSEHSVFGHLIQTLIGIDNEFSLVRLGIMALYVGIMYLWFLRKSVASVSAKSS